MIMQSLHVSHSLYLTSSYLVFSKGNACVGWFRMGVCEGGGMLPVLGVHNKQSFLSLPRLASVWMYECVFVHVISQSCCCCCCRSLNGAKSCKQSLGFCCASEVKILPLSVIDSVTPTTQVFLWLSIRLFLSLTVLPICSYFPLLLTHLSYLPSGFENVYL